MFRRGRFAIIISYALVIRCTEGNVLRREEDQISMRPDPEAGEPALSPHRGSSDAIRIQEHHRKGRHEHEQSVLHQMRVSPKTDSTSGSADVDDYVSPRYYAEDLLRRLAASGFKYGHAKNPTGWNGWNVSGSPPGGKNKGKSKGNSSGVKDVNPNGIIGTELYHDAIEATIHISLSILLCLVVWGVFLCLRIVYVDMYAPPPPSPEPPPLQAVLQGVWNVAPTDDQRRLVLFPHFAGALCILLFIITVSMLGLKTLARELVGPSLEFYLGLFQLPLPICLIWECARSPDLILGQSFPKCRPVVLKNKQERSPSLMHDMGVLLIIVLTLSFATLAIFMSNIAVMVEFPDPFQAYWASFAPGLGLVVMKSIWVIILLLVINTFFSPLNGAHAQCYVQFYYTITQIFIIVLAPAVGKSMFRFFLHSSLQAVPHVLTATIPKATALFGSLIILEIPGNVAEVLRLPYHFRRLVGLPSGAVCLEIGERCGRLSIIMMITIVAGPFDPFVYLFSIVYFFVKRISLGFMYWIIPDKSLHPESWPYEDLDGFFWKNQMVYLFVSLLLATVIQGTMQVKCAETLIQRVSAVIIVLGSLYYAVFRMRQLEDDDELKEDEPIATLSSSPPRAA